MSGFLARLAERALGGGTATRPLLPRRFAPLPPGADPDRAFWERALARQLDRGNTAAPTGDTTPAGTSTQGPGERR